jgi:hypothetical protein
MAKARVRYKGFSDVREITAAQLEPLGIHVSADLVFDRSNNFTMVINLNDELTDIFRKEGTFTISEIKDDHTIGDEIVTATLADDTAVAATVVDGDTGQKSHNPNVTSSTPATPTTASGKVK